MKLFKRTTTTTAPEVAAAPGITMTSSQAEAAAACAALLAAELDVIERVRSQGGSIVFGAPTRCPECGCYGMVEHLDLTAGRAANKCPSCGHRWNITKRALRLSDAALEDAEVTRPIGDGILVRNLTAA